MCKSILHVLVSSYRVDTVIGELSKQACKYSQQKIGICQEFQEIRETMGKIQQ